MDLDLRIDIFQTDPSLSCPHSTVGYVFCIDLNDSLEQLESVDDVYDAKAFN